MVVADISEESANETLGSLPSDFRGQGHMVGMVDVSSKESVKKLVTSIQVHSRDRETITTLHFQRPLCSLDYTFEYCSLFYAHSIVLLSLYRVITSSRPRCA